MGDYDCEHKAIIDSINAETPQPDDDYDDFSHTILEP